MNYIKWIDMTGEEISEERYAMIETVYMYHPSAREMTPVIFLELYRMIGIQGIKDLYGRAKKIKDLIDKVNASDIEDASIGHELSKLTLCI